MLIIKKMEYIFLLIVIALSFIVAHIQNDIISPTFPDMLEFFKTKPSTFHLMSSSNFLGIAIAGALFGPISDNFGRRITLIIALSLFFLGSFGCVMAKTIEQLIIWRFIQGAGAAGPITICVVLIYDFFSKKSSSQIVALMDGIITSSKSLFPIFGGWLNAIYGWQVNFIVLLILISLAIILVTLFLKEPLEQDKKIKINIKQLLLNYKIVISNKYFLFHALILGLMASCITVYLTSMPLIFINHMGVAKIDYGFYHSSIMASFALSSFATHFLIEFLNIELTRKIGFYCILIGTSFLVISTIHLDNPINFTIAMIINCAGFAILIAIFMSDAMTILPELKGYASSMIASIRLTLISILVAITGYFFNGTIKPVTIILTLCCITCFILRRTALNKITDNR